LNQQHLIAKRIIKEQVLMYFRKGLYNIMEIALEPQVLNKFHKDALDLSLEM